MPDFRLDDTDGDPRSLSEVRGDRPALVYFYSGCCGHCSDQLPGMSELARDYDRSGAAIIGVEYLGNTSTCRKNREEFELLGTVLADSDGQVCGRMDVGDFTVFTLDEEGVIRYRGSVDRVPGS